MAWLPFVDATLPIGDVIYGVGIIVLGVYSVIATNELFSTVISSDKKESYITQYSEHTKGARKSTKQTHQKGQTRKKRDNQGEKGDKRRIYLGNKKRVMMALFVADNLFNQSIRKCDRVECCLY